MLIQRNFSIKKKQNARINSRRVQIRLGVRSASELVRKAIDKYLKSK